MDLNKYLSQLTDPYERKARLWPGLLVIAPVLVALATHFGSKNPVLAACVGVLGTCGGAYALGNVARGKGKELEERLLLDWSGMPTTILLRHRDTRLESTSKLRYHELIEKKLGLAMPTEEEERKEPLKADDAYIGACRRLRELTRGDRGLLFKENVAYGFHRNMLGLKPLGLGLSIAVLLFGLWQARILDSSAPFVHPEELVSVNIAAGTTMLVAFAFTCAWIFYFTAASLRRIGFSYAERLYERLSSLKAASKSRQKEP